jgi:hypothetical protein
VKSDIIAKLIYVHCSVIKYSETVSDLSRYCPHVFTHHSCAIGAMAAQSLR